ncbi:alpha/beta fold hydrolase [Arenibacter sp. GZD96]|uniref:alpha/beta fold hydrolase n=1 Tax=Aurantibrevibacter litoralis TaxID=3106030 RepID=UPI002AFE9940|nr:alpha/beta fold hydrolase [Arenibacter sp. GZD-96]MEA1784835.1 alpha/beta fold hydrolase [Arenibacter sp. GZD-96]
MSASSTAQIPPSPNKDTTKKNIILLHGLFGELSNWHNVVRSFGNTHTIYTPKLPLFEKVLCSSHLDRFVSFLEAYIADHGIEQPVLVGNSLGGHIALRYTLKHPQQVSSLVLTGSSGLYENTFGNSFPRVNDYDYIRTKIHEVFYNTQVIDEALVHRVFKTLNNRQKALAIIRIARDAKKQNLKNELHKIKVPVLLIWGMQDVVTPLSVAEEFYLSFSKARLHLLNHCGHVPMMEQPEAFNNILGDFLAETPLKVV